MNEQLESVFVPDVGFRPTQGGLALARPVTITKDPEHALRVMHLISTAGRGTELAFEMRDMPREAAARAGHTDYGWHSRMQLQLRDAAGASVRRSQGRDSFSMGQHEFGFLRQDLLFEQLPPDTRRLTLEIRGDLGEWDVPLEVAPIGETAVIPVVQSDVKTERDGIAVRMLGLARTESATYVEIQAIAIAPQGSVLGVGGWMRRNEGQALTIVDDRGNRFEEVFSGSIAHRNQRGGRSVAAFPPLREDASSLTLVVSTVLVQEVEGSLDVAIPVHVPTELSFGPYPLTIRWADIVGDLRVVPGQPPSRGIDIQLKRERWHENRHVLRPGKLLIDGARTWNFGLNHADASAIHVTISLRDQESAKTITLLEPVVEVRGPWEIEFV